MSNNSFLAESTISVIRKAISLNLLPILSGKNCGLHWQAYTVASIGNINTYITIPPDNGRKFATRSGTGASKIWLDPSTLSNIAPSRRSILPNFSRRHTRNLPVLSRYQWEPGTQGQSSKYREYVTCSLCTLPIVLRGDWGENRGERLFDNFGPSGNKLGSELSLF